MDAMRSGERVGFLALTIQEAVETLDAVEKSLSDSELDELVSLALRAGIARDNIVAILRVHAEDQNA